MSYLQRTGNSRNNISWTNTSSNSIKYLHRTGTGRTNIKWSTISTSANILQRNGTGRNNILWANLTVKTQQAITNGEMLDAYMQLINDFDGARNWYSNRANAYSNTANALTILDNGLMVESTSVGGDSTFGDGLIIASVRYASGITTRVYALDDQYSEKCIWNSSNIYHTTQDNHYTGRCYLYSINYWRASASSSLCTIGLEIRTGHPNDSGYGNLLVNSNRLRTPVYVYD